MGVGVAFFLFFVLFKKERTKRRKGGVSDGGEADFQTQPPTLTTYPRFFVILF